MMNSLISDVEKEERNAEQLMRCEGNRRMPKQPHNRITSKIQTLLMIKKYAKCKQDHYNYIIFFILLSFKANFIQNQNTDHLNYHPWLLIFYAQYFQMNSLKSDFNRRKFCFICKLFFFFFFSNIT